ncbi:MAG: 2-methylcitrate dehydratase [Candidatus Rokuibacteriota bacterium]|nr:MAG: 2-methylcitrate dehydratase [Candidatus Rokubacteria bacterium]
MNDGKTPVIDSLVEFVIALDPAALPAAVTEAASLCLTDWLGTAVRGSKEPLADALAAVINASGGEPQATVVGRGLRTSALFAAMANGAQAHALDFDDTHLPSIVHGSAPVAPVVLALAEWRHRSGRDVLGAFVAGFEVETRIGRVAGRTLADRGWHVTGVLGHFGATAAAGKLLGLTRAQLRHAFGIAGTQAAGLEQSFGTMCKPLHPGKAAMNGLLSALLAREGFTGPTGVLDTHGGLLSTFVGIDDLSRATAGLGTRFEILENSTKAYAACHLTHATIDAGRAIRERLASGVDAITAIECRVHPLTLKVAANPDPRTGLEAKFSVAYCAASALVRGDAGEGEFTDEAVREPVVARLRQRVTPVADAAMGIGTAHMTIRLADGSVIDEHVKAARGTAENPLTREEFEAKFRRLAAVVLPDTKIEQLVTGLRSFTTLADAGKLVALAAR